MSERDTIEAIAAEVERQITEGQSGHYHADFARDEDMITVTGYVKIDLAVLAAAIERRK